MNNRSFAKIFFLAGIVAIILSQSDMAVEAFERGDIATSAFITLVIFGEFHMLYLFKRAVGVSE